MYKELSQFMKKRWEELEREAEEKKKLNLRTHQRMVEESLNSKGNDPFEFYNIDTERLNDYGPTLDHLGHRNKIVEDELSVDTVEELDSDYFYFM